MNRQVTIYTSFSADDMAAFEPALKIGLLATVADEGAPHLTLISTLGASTPAQLVWGQFTEGSCKQFIRENPKAGFLIMTLDRQLWRGKADFSHMAKEGPDFDRYNSTPMFRYNAYFGIHTVYYMDLIEHYGREALPMGSVVLAAIKTMIARLLASGQGGQVLNAWTRQLMNRLSNLKFVAYVGEDGYPVVVPAIQAQAADGEHVIFSTSAYGDDLRAIPPRATVAVFGMSLDMEDVLVRGAFLGTKRVAGLLCGVVRVNWVYNPMPPKPQQIYPELEIEPVTDFS